MKSWSSLREISPRLHIERHYPDVPPDITAKTEVLYTAHFYPAPEQAPKLRWIQMHTAGMNQALDFPIMQAEDIIATSTSGMHAGNMAHYCLMMMLMWNYNMPGAFAMQRQAEWPPRASAHFMPIDMERQTVGIVGYGSVGRELARLCKTMGMTVLASKRDLSNTAERNAYAIDGMGDPSGDIPDRIYPADTVASMARACDYLVVTVPQTAATEHLINEEVLDAMKPTAVLVNVSRGVIVDEKALITALSSGKIAGAALGCLRRRAAAEDQPAVEPGQCHHHAAYCRRHPRLLRQSCARLQRKICAAT